MAFVGLSDSYEQFYQAVRRCWRFGQTKEVHANVVTSSLEGAVVANIKRKERDAQKMAQEMAKYMAEISTAEIKGAKKETIHYRPNNIMTLPKFLNREAA